MSKELFVRYGLSDFYSTEDDAPNEFTAKDNDGKTIAFASVSFVDEMDEGECLYEVTDMVVSKDVKMPSYAIGDNDSTEVEIYFVGYEDEDGNECNENGEKL